MMIVRFSWLVFLSFLACGAVAQQDSFRLKKADSTLTKAQNAIEKKLNKADSATNVFSNNLNKASRLQLPDSLRKPLVNYNQKLDSIKRKLTHRIDSLKTLKLPTERYASLLDSINKSGPIKKIKETEAKLAKLQAKVNEPSNKVNSSISRLGNKVNAPLDGLRQEGVGLPGINAPGLQIPTVGGLPNTNLNLPNASLPNVNPLQGSNGLPSATNGLPANNLSNPLANLGGLGDVQKELQNVGEITNQTKQYSNELKDISKGDLTNTKNLSREAEQQAAKIEVIKELGAEKQILEDYKKKAELGKNPEEMKKLAEQEVRKEAINHFAGNEEILTQAMGQMERFKLKYPDAATMHDITKRVHNQMHGKPIIERIVPAFSLQILSKGDFLIDFNPQVGYRLSGKWTAGIGWVERIQFHSISKVIPEGRIFGPRGFTDIKWKKGFGFRAEVEYINLYVSPTNAGDGNTRPWVWGVLAGIKKDYKIARGINGNIQVLYKVDSPWFFLNPYADRFNIRIGMEFPLRKAKKES